MMCSLKTIGPRQRLAVWWIAPVAAAWLASCCAATASEPLRYRRVFVPQEELEGQIRGLLPMKREDFERQIRDAGKAAGTPSPGTMARIERATYRARLVGEQLVEGTAELVIHCDQGPALLPLGKSNLALGDVVWAGTPTRTAVLGNDVAGALGCLVERSGTLELRWSLSGAAPAPEAASFLFQAPPATISTLILDLPAGRSLSAAGAIVSQLEATDARANDSAGIEQSSQSWLVEIGGPGTVELRVEPIGRDLPPEPLVAVRESSTYSLLRSSLDLETLLELDLFNQRLSKLELRIEKPLEVTGIRSGDQALNWSIAVARENAVTIVVDLPELPAGGDSTIQILASALWPTDGPTRLPRISLQDAVYQEGKMTVVAPAWLRVQARPISGCWQAAVAPAGPGRATDQLQFRLHAADAAVEISADLSPARLKEVSGTQFTIDATQVNAVLHAELTSLGGDRFHVEARIPRRWIIDAVEVLPADSLSDRTNASAGPNHQLLRLNLRRAISEVRPVRIMIRAHQRRPAGNQPLPEEFFSLAAFADTPASRRLIAVRTADANTQLQLSDDHRLARLDAAQLSEEEMRLFESLPGSILFVDDDTGALTGSLTTAAASYRAEAALEAFVSRQQVRQAMTLRCIPQSSAVGSAVVRLSPKPDAPITWKLDGEVSRDLEVQPLPLEQPSTPGGAHDGVYRLTLLRPRSTPFTVQAEWTEARDDRHPLSLASFPEAVAQAGLASIHSLDGAPLRIQPLELQALPVAAVEPTQFTSLRGRFSYQPGGRGSLSISLLQADQTPPAARVDSLQVHSRFSIDGCGEHEATLAVVNQGLSDLLVELPANAMNVRSIDRATGAVLTPPRNSDGQILVPLAANQRHVDLQLRYSTPGTPLGWWPTGRFQAPIPEPNIPVQDRKWSVALCPELQAAADAGGGLSPLALLGLPWNSRTAKPLSPVSLPGQSLARTANPTLSVETPRKSDAGLTGWRRHEFALPSGHVASIDVYRPQGIHGLALAAFFLSAAIVWRCGVRARPWVLPGVGMATVVALVVTPVWAPLAMGAALGVLAGGMALLARSRRGGTSRERSSSFRQRLGMIASLLLVGGWFAAMSIEDGAAAEDLGASEKTIHRVVIPTDDQRQPVGDYVYLSPEFYEQMHQVEPNGAAELPDWLIKSARYQLPSEPRLAGRAASIDELAARFEVETFRAGLVMELPLKRDELLLLEGRSRMDGESVAAHWRDDGAALLIPVERAGAHLIELALGAPAAKTADGIVLDIGIPAVARSTVRAPLKSPGPTIVSALGGRLAADEPDVSETALGLARRLIVRWPAQGRAAIAARVEVEQLLHWNVRPGSVVVDGKFRFRPIGGALKRVRIAVDPRLRLVPGSLTPVPARMSVEEGAQNVLNLFLADEKEAELSLDATWLWVGASGAGNLVLPQISAQGDRLVRSWSAVSLDPALTLESSSAQEGIAVDDFLAAWDEPGAGPTLAFRDVAGAQRSVIVRPALSQPKATTTTNWSVDLRRASVLFEARLSGVSAERFGHVLELPPRLQATRVTLTDGVEPLAQRWTQRPDGSVAITLLAAPTPEQLLTVEAQMNVAGDRPTQALPLIQLQQSTLTQRELRIYRKPGVQLRLAAAPGWERREDPELGHRVDARGRLVAILRKTDESADAQPVVAVAENRPRLGGRLALRVATERGAWFAEADLQLKIEGGVVDTIYLDVPADWSGPLEITPAVEHRMTPLPGGTTHQVQIWLQQAARDRMRLTLRGPLRISAGQSIRAPHVTVRDAPDLERTVVLASRIGADQVQWETSGLQAADAPLLDLPEGWTDEGESAYRVVAPQFEAVPTVSSEAPKRPQVTLANIAVVKGPNQRLRGRAIFYVEPTGTNEFVLEMPPASRLIQVSVDGIAAQCWPEGVRTWRIATSSPRLPLSVEVVFDGAWPSRGLAGGQPSIGAPRMRALSVKRTLWSLSAIEPGQAPKDGSPLEVQSDVHAALVEAEVFAAYLLLVADSRPGELPLDVVVESYRNWRGRFDAAQARAEALLRKARASDPRLVAKLQSTQSKADEAKRRLTEAGILDAAVGSDALAVSEQAASSTEVSQQPTFLLADGWMGEVPVLGSSESARPDEDRWAFAAGIAVLFWCVWFLQRLAPIRQWLAAHAAALLGLGGLIWWLLAPWPWLGWIVVVLAVWSALRSPFPGSENLRVRTAPSHH